MAATDNTVIDEVTTRQNEDAKKPSPKVIWLLIAGLLLSAAQAAAAALAAAVTPEALSPVVGPLWATTIATLVTTVLNALVAYLKGDPLRNTDVVVQRTVNPVTVIPAGGESPQGVAADLNPTGLVDSGTGTVDVTLEDDGYDPVNPLGSPGSTVQPATGTGPRHLGTAPDPADEHPQP